MNYLRYFIALEIPEESRQQLEYVQEKIKQLVPSARLTDNNKLHLTIAFVGEYPESLKTDLVRILQNAAFEIPPFEVTPAYIDGFNNLHHAHVLWVGVKGDIDKLMIIRERIKDGFENLHLSVDERRYTPHITIAKLHNFYLQKPVERAFQEMMMQNFDPIWIKTIKLFESVPDQGIHTHNTLAEILLQPPLKMPSNS